MTKAERIYNTLETIEEKGKIIYSYIFIYGFAFLFIILGIILILTPANPPEYPKWLFIILGLFFSMEGFAFLLMAIKFSLEDYIYD